MTRSTFTTAFATLSVLAIRAAAESCEEVWFVEGSFVGETFTCGERIVYLQTPQGGGKTEQEARVQASLEELKCADCWPWEKYREDGETERSPKRGIAIENHKLTPESLSGLSQIVSWGVTWHYNLTDGPDLEVWNMAGVDFVPLIWGAGSLPLAQADGLPEGRSTLLGFNEPNFPNQANLDPETAANLWKDVEALAEEHNISTIVSPSMNWHVSMDPIEWLERFFAACEGCQVDAIGIHVFTCYAAGLKYHLDRYRVFGKPMWITEIACSDPNSPERLSAEGQMAYMMEAIPLLEADEDVAKYAWFSYFKNEWEHPIVDGENGDAGLIFPNGTLTPLGKLYKNFAAGTNLTEINITEPSSTTTVSQTKTVTSTTSITATGSSTQTFTGETSSTKESTEPTTESTTTTAAESSTSSTVEATAPTTESTTVAESTTESTTASTTASTAASTSQEPSSVSQTTETQSSTESSTTKEETSTTTLQKEKVTTPLRSLSTMTAPSTTLPEGGESTTTEEVDQEENVTNETFSCTEAVDAWCQSDPASAPFFPLRHCSDWRLHDAMCSSPGGGKNNAPQFAGTTELEDSGSFPALFLLLAVLGAAMAGAALASLFYRRQNHKCILCCGRNKKEEQEQEDLKRAISQKSDWQGNCLPVMCNRNGPNSKVAPEPGLLLPMEAVARRVGSSPVAAEVCGSPVIGTLSKKGNAPEVAVGTPVGTTPASRAAALSTLTEAMAKATSADVSLDEREIALHQAGRVLCSKAALNLPLALRQEAETWHSRQEERLNLAKSMEAVVERAANLEEAAECEATAADPLGALLSRAVVADKVELEALLGESARRASAFEDELDNQRIRLHREPRPANQSLLTAADLMKQTSDLTEMQTKAARELTELQALQDPGAGEEWKTACDSLETKWKQFVADSGAAVQEAQAALAANRTAKILSSDAEREAALAEAARRQATFQEELQKQRQKLQKRTKAKSAAPTPLELGRLLEDEGVLQALELDRDTAMKECQQFIDTAEARHCDAEAKQWKELLQGWQVVKEDMAQVASSNQELSEAMPEATVWASAASKAKIGKVTVDDDEQLALLAEAARCAAAFDEELQKQRQQMKKRRKALQKGGSEQATDPLDVCRTMADEEALKRLSRQQAEAHAKCQAMATSGEGMSEAWEQLAATWVQMEKDINKAEKEVSEASKVVTSDAHSELVAALGLAQDGEVARDAEDGSASQREALQEAARRIAVFDEELAKQRAAMRRRRSENPQGANALGAALLEGEALKALAAECAEAVAVCEAAAAEASKEGGQAEPWQDILKVWANLRADLAEATEEAEAEAKICRAHEASEALAAHGVAAAARRAVAFEHELGQLTREGAHESGAVEADVRRAHKTALVQKLKTEHAEGLAFCEAKVAATRAEEETPHLVECRNAWQELVELWQGLGKDLETAAQELATSTEPAGALRKILDASVSDAERQKALAEAARRAAQFDEELQRQRQRLVRRKKVGENISSRVLALGDAVELQALAADQEAAKSACQDALTKAEASNDVEQAQGWKQIMDVYVALDNELDAQKKEIQATGSFSAEPAAEAGRQMVQKVIRDQKQSAESCLKAVEHALNTDRGPLEGLIEAQQAPRSVKSNGGSTHRSRHLEAAAQVQTWDVLEEAQGVLESLKKQSPGKPVAMENLKQLGDEASKQLKEISDQAKAVKQESTVTQDEKPSETPSVKRGQRDFGCQTVFRLGGMAWHANPAIQKLLEELAKVSTQGGSGQEPANLDKLEGEVNEVINHWRKEFIGKRREASITRITRSRSRSQSRLMPEAPSPASAPPTSPPAPPAPPTMLEADLVAQAAKKKEVEAAPASPALDNIKRDEVRVEIESTSFQSSQFDNNKPAPSMDQVLDDSRRPETEDARPPSGNLSSRRIQADSRRMSTGSTNSDYEDQSANRQRRRRSSSRDGRIDLGASVDSSRPTQPELEVPKEPPQHGHQGEEPQGEFLAQLEQMRVSGSQAASVSEDRRDSKNLPRPSSASSRRGGPGDGSLLVPPAGDAASRSVSPSSAGSSPSPGHSAPRRLDPIVRPRGPPLPSAGRLLLASQQENISESAKTSPRSGH